MSYFIFTAESYRIRTPRERFHTNNLNVRKAYFRFRLKGCEDSYVDLLTNAQDKASAAYALQIGEESNSKTVLYSVTDSVKTQLTSVNTEDVLHCDIMRQFWVTFDKSNDIRYIKFGTGWELDQNTLLDYQHTNPVSVNGLSLGTNMPSNHAYWEYDRYAGGY